MKAVGKILLLAVIVQCCCGVLFAQQNNQAYDDYVLYDESMFKVLYNDFKSDKTHRVEKIDCYVRYTKLFFKTICSQITAPFGYVGYYCNRKKITARLESFYKDRNLENINNIGNDIKNGVIDKDELKDYLGSFYYNLWLYGDTESPVETGGVPKDYKPAMSMFWRRWFYSGLRNPKWNATYINNYSSDILKVSTVYDTRKDIVTHNYGTGDTKLGAILRWYVDDCGKWWFFYENTEMKTNKTGRLFYFGAVGLGNTEDGILFGDGKSQKSVKKKGRFEFSLNRKVTID